MNLNTIGQSEARLFASGTSVLARAGVLPTSAPRSRIEVSSPQIRRFEFHLPDGTVSVAQEGEEPVWFYSMLNKLQSIATLGPNWDSYGGAPLSFDAALASLRFMAEYFSDSAVAPSVVPSSSGGVQLEWHRHAGDLEITFSPTGSYSAFFIDGQAGTEWEMESEMIDPRKLAAAVDAVTAAARE